MAWAAFQAGLVRCEQLERAGSEYEREASDLRERLGLLARDLTHRPLQANTAACNLPLLLAAQESPLPDPEIVERLFFEEPKPGGPSLADFRYPARALAAWAGRENVLNSIAWPKSSKV